MARSMKNQGDEFDMRASSSEDVGMKVLLVEDEPKVANYLREGLSQQGWLVDVAMDGEEGIFRANEYEFDVIILDVMLPRKDGLSVLRELRKHDQTPVVMLTARDRVDDRVQALRAGADDYVIKPFSFLELVERLHAVTRRVRSQHTMMVQVGNLNVDLIGRRAGRNGVRLELTAKEFQLLSALARRRGQILSKTQIAELVWDVDFESNTNVVETAIKRLRAKLDGPFESKLLHTIRGMGYVLEERDIN
jgi:two-component system copper resistance phosphate regulon response regulator CusR